MNEFFKRIILKSCPRGAGVRNQKGVGVGRFARRSLSNFITAKEKNNVEPNAGSANKGDALVKGDQNGAGKRPVMSILFRTNIFILVTLTLLCSILNAVALYTFRLCYLLQVSPSHPRQK